MGLFTRKEDATIEDLEKSLKTWKGIGIGAVVALAATLIWAFTR